MDGVESGSDIVSIDKNDRYSFQMVMKTNSFKLYNPIFFLLSGNVGDKNTPSNRLMDVFIYLVVLWRQI